MLVLNRKLGQSIVIADDITIKVIEIKNGSVRLGITAPSDTQVNRVETKEWALPPLGDPFPHRDPQPKRAAKVFRRLHWTAREDDYLRKCIADHPKLGDAVRKFLAMYPGRSTDAIRRRAWGMQKGTVK